MRWIPDRVRACASRIQDRPLRYGLPAATIVLVIVALLSPASYFNTDELIYSLMAEAATRGQLTVENGYEAFPSPGLLAHFLVPGPSGTAPQYAAGYGFLAAPFYWLGGLHGLVLLNALAFAATLAVTFRLALALGLDKAGALRSVLILALGTYALEYAFGIWPHALSMFVVALSAWLALPALRAPGPRAGPAFLSGLLLGVGVTIRPDASLLLPGLAYWLVARGSPWRPLFALAGGLLPGFALSVWLNHLRFGTWAVLSYGSESGNVSFGRYLPLGMVLLAGLGVLAVLSRPGVRKRVRARIGLAILLLGVVTILLNGGARQTAFELLRGVYVLVIDLQAYSGVGGGTGVDIGEGGYVYFYGGLKRAFLQSLPYLGLLPLMIAGVRGYSPKASAYSLFLSVSAFWIAPFALTEWHGGLSFNMRYFVPLLPFVSVASAAAIQELERALAPDTDRVFQSAKRVGCYTAIAAALAFILVAASPVVGYALALYVPLLLASALAAASVVFLRRPPARCRPAAATAFLLAVSSVVWAGASAIVHDVNMTWKLRAEVADVNSVTALLEDQIVVVTNIPEYFRAQFLREGSIVATVSARRPFDVVALAEHYLSQWRPVYIHHEDTPVPEVLEWLSQYETRFVDLGSIRLAVARPE